MSGAGLLRAVPQRSAGFALIIVLWALVLIAFIVDQVVATGRTEIKIAGNLVANAATEAAADGAVSQTIFTLLAPQPQQRWPLDGSPHQFAIGDCRVTVRLTDEAARVNPNLASPALLQALLHASGSPTDNARSLAAAIAEWVGTSGGASTPDALAGEYRAAGLDYAPPGERMESLSELRRVIGMTPPLYDAIRGHLSLYAPAEPEAAGADPVVAAAVAAANQGASGEPAAVAAVPDSITARIEVIAEGPGNARAERTVIVRIVAGLGAYTVLAWRRSGEEP